MWLFFKEDIQMTKSHKMLNTLNIGEMNIKTTNKCYLVWIRTAIIKIL